MGRDNLWESKILLTRWIRLVQSGINIKELFEKRGYARIALYGLEAIAECLLYELYESGVEVTGIIDRQAKKKIWLMDCSLFALEEVSGLEVEAIVVMPVGNFDEIVEDLRKYTSARIISLGDILYEI